MLWTVSLLPLQWPRSSHHSWPTVLTLLLLLLSINSVRCQPINVAFYNVINAAAFNGASLTTTGNGCMLNGAAVLECPSGSKLDDNVTDGSISTDLGRYFAFTTSSDGRIEITLTSRFQNISITIYYYNSPSELIGFPSVSVTTTLNTNPPISDVSVPFIFSSSPPTPGEPASIQSAVLHLLPSQPINFIALQFDFKEQCDTEWLLISEVDFEANAVIPSANVSASSVLSEVICQSTSSVIITASSTSSSSIPSTSTLSAFTTNSISQNMGSSTPQTGTSSASQKGSTTSMDRTSLTQPMTLTTTSTVTDTTPGSSSASILPPPPSSAGSSDILPVAIGAVAAVVIILLILIIIIIAVIFYCNTRKRKMLSDLRGASQGGMELTDNNGVPSKEYEDENKGELVYSMIVKKDNPPPAIPPQNFDPEEATDLGTGQNVGLEWANSSKPTLAKITKAIGLDLVPNPIYDESPAETNEGPYYSTASSYQNEAETEAMYTEVPDKPSAAPVEAVYSTPEYFDLRNPIYDQADPYDDPQIRPFSFVSSGGYSDGPIYSVPEVVANKQYSVLKTGEWSFHEVKELGVGQFGEVVLGKTVGLSLKDLGLSETDDNKDISLSVAIKKMKADADQTSMLSFEKEMKFVSQLRHQNVVQLLAVSQEGSGPFMVMEYMENGDLNQFLLWHDISPCHPPKQTDLLSPQHLLSMSIQIANGLTYLASHNYIHRDVATRNCLVGEDNIVKIADFGLSRNLYDSVYYRVKGKAKMPIRWMATECFYGKFSQFSDVWAYGVTVWEIYTLARGPPYSNLDDQEVLDDALKKDGRMILDKPSSCPKEVYDCIRSSCFVGDFSKRAPFSSIHSQLLEIKQQLYG